MVDLPNTTVDLANTMVDLPITMVDLPNTMGHRKYRKYSFFLFLPISFNIIQFLSAFGVFSSCLFLFCPVSSYFFQFHLVFPVYSRLFFKFYTRSLALIALALFEICRSLFFVYVLSPLLLTGTERAGDFWAKCVLLKLENKKKTLILWKAWSLFLVL